MKRKKKKGIHRIICLLVVLSMLLQNGVQTVWAWSDNPTEAAQDTERVSLTEGEDTTTDVLQEENAEPEILHEIEENRAAFSKEYLMSDNSKTMVVYPQKIHYEAEDGSLVEIDNSLIKTEDGYRNGSNSYDVLITDNENSQGEVIYKEDEYEISWQMVELVEKEDSEKVQIQNKTKEDNPSKEESGKQKEKSKENKNDKEKKHKKEIHKPQLGAIVTDNTEEVPLLQENEAIHQVEQSTVTFDGYSNGVSVEYEPTGDGIKENIILTTKESGNEYIFNVQMSGLKARLNTNNEIEFHDEDTDEIMYYFPAPFMIDNEGEVSYEAGYELVNMSEELGTDEEADTEAESESESESDPGMIQAMSRRRTQTWAPCPRTRLGSKQCQYWRQAQALYLKMKWETKQKQALELRKNPKQE